MALSFISLLFFHINSFFPTMHLYSSFSVLSFSIMLIIFTFPLPNILIIFLQLFYTFSFLVSLFFDIIHRVINSVVTYFFPLFVLFFSMFIVLISDSPIFHVTAIFFSSFCHFFVSLFLLLKS